MSSIDGSEWFRSKDHFRKCRANKVVVEGIEVSLMDPRDLVTYRKHLGGEHQNVDIIAVEKYINENHINNKFLVKICIWLLLFNAVFWLLAASIFSFSQYGANAHWLVRALLFLEAVLYVIAFLGVKRRIRLIYVGAIVLALGNCILSLTDEIDFSDIFSLMISGLALISLLSMWREIFVQSPSHASIKEH